MAVPVYAGVSELELGLILAVCRLCAGADAEAGTVSGGALTVNRSRASIVSAGGLVTTPHVLYAALPAPAALFVPGGPGAARAARDPQLQAFLRTHRALPIGASGGGLLLLGAAGLLRDRAVGGPAELADTLWGDSPHEVQPGQCVTDKLLCTTPGGFPALHAALHVAGAVWGADAAAGAARRLGHPA